MKNLIVLGIALACFSSNSIAQKSRNFRGKSKKDFFGGAQDYRNITKNGLQVSFGPNYTFTKLKNTSVSGTDATGRPITSTIDPMGRIGGFIDVGVAHYRLKPSKILTKIGDKNKEGFVARRIKSNLFHRVDWGLGFDYIGGREKSTVDLFNALGQKVSTNETIGKFYNGYLTGRFTADRFTQFSENWHLETGLGINFAYNILSAPKQAYSSTSTIPNVFQKNFLTQIHAHIGMNYRIRKGDYFTFGFYLPALGIYERNKLKPTIQWFASNYYPAHLQLKWIHHFTRKSNGCNTGSPEDKKRNEEFMQNR